MSVASQPPTEDAVRVKGRERRLPGDIHMWVLVLGEFCFFGSYLIVYMIDRATSSHAAYTAAQHHLNLNLGALNTIILMTSSLLVALAVIATRHGDPKGAERRILAAAGCGVLFLIIKGYEWYSEAKYYSIDNEFLSHYYTITGLHLIHLVIGLIVMGMLVRELREPRLQRPGIIEQGALYWHMIDVIWVLIFAALYLLR